MLPSFDNPFADQETDRSQPVLLQSMRDLSRYVAADGTFQVIVDLQENKENIPDFLVNQRTLFVGSGSVEAYVDFSSLAEGAIEVDEDEQHRRRSRCPRRSCPQAALDMERSYVVAEERGLLNRIGDAFRSDPNQQQRVYQEAQKRITEAARSSGLDQRARENTQKMLESLLARLGYTLGHGDVREPVRADGGLRRVTRSASAPRGPGRSGSAGRAAGRTGRTAGGRRRTTGRNGGPGRHTRRRSIGRRGAG